MQKFPKLSRSGLSLLQGLLTYDPDRRLTARQAIRHPYFNELPLAKLPQDMPYFPSAHDADAKDDQHIRFASTVPLFVHIGQLVWGPQHVALCRSALAKGCQNQIVYQSSRAAVQSPMELRLSC